MVDGFTEVKDSGARREFGTGSVRDVRAGKGRYDLLPPYVIDRLARHFENGAAKYGDRNWQKGQPLSGYLDSALRHTFNLLDGMTDEDHAAAAMWNIGAFIWTQREIAEGRLPAELDDMPRDEHPEDAANATAPLVFFCEDIDHPSAAPAFPHAEYLPRNIEIGQAS